MTAHVERYLFIMNIRVEFPRSVMQKLYKQIMALVFSVPCSNCGWLLFLFLGCVLCKSVQKDYD